MWWSNSTSKKLFSPVAIVEAVTALSRFENEIFCSKYTQNVIQMAFDKRESFENNQKFNIIPTPDDANTRNFHVESVRLPGYYLQVAQDGNNNSKDAQMQIFNNQFQRWNLK